MIRSIPGFPDYHIDEFGNTYSTKYGDMRPLKQQIVGSSGKTYYHVQMRRNGRYYQEYVGGLVLLAFVGPCPTGMQVCHGPNGKHDNSLSNLSWGTPSKNNKEDKIRDGTSTRGENNPMAKLNELQVRVMRRAHAFGLGFRELAEVFSICDEHVRRIVKRESWQYTTQ